MAELESLLRPDRYQVFLTISPASVPLNFACHPWFVVNNIGTVARWGVGWRPAQYGAQKQWGHLAKDVLPPFQGLRIFYLSREPSWKSSLIKVIEGDSSSLAAQMVAAIERSPQTYPYRETYSFFGPNSNTYVQWVLDQFPESGMRLPWNAFGKNYRPKALKKS
ncbi:DUF3750 domain-containing protein [Candidatus Kaiserbacteria bacterium]|nr:DUF3750 domain-containing protein [Candidatus Kaiserbacteria bacterium]